MSSARITRSKSARSSPAARSTTGRPSSSGLAAGERVITGGLHKAAPEQTVSPVGLAEPGK
ncbi:MAG: hypothetical protein V8T86_15595 [Victivallis sp.]